jgi:peroxiredoxin Q/BCP
MYGRKYFGIERTTFLINKKQMIIKTWNKVKVANHVEEVIAYIENN